MFGLVTIGLITGIFILLFGFWAFLLIGLYLLFRLCYGLARD